jgi:hypothetical protein
VVRKLLVNYAADTAAGRGFRTASTVMVLTITCTSGFTHFIHFTRPAYLLEIHGVAPGINGGYLANNQLVFSMFAGKPLWLPPWWLKRRTKTHKDTDNFRWRSEAQ